MVPTALTRRQAVSDITNLQLRDEAGSCFLSIGGYMSTTSPVADRRFLRRVLVALVVATLASGAMMAYAAASMS